MPATNAAKPRSRRPATDLASSAASTPPAMTAIWSRLSGERGAGNDTLCRIARGSFRSVAMVGCPAIRSPVRIHTEFTSGGSCIRKAIQKLFIRRKSLSFSLSWICGVSVDATDHTQRLARLISFTCQRPSSSRQASTSTSAHGDSTKNSPGRAASIRRMSPDGCTSAHRQPNLTPSLRMVAASVVMRNVDSTREVAWTSRLNSVLRTRGRGPPITRTSRTASISSSMNLALTRHLDPSPTASPSGVTCPAHALAP